MATSDPDVDALISRLSGPLLPPARVAFRAAALDALARVPAWAKVRFTGLLRLSNANSGIRPRRRITLLESGRGGLASWSPVRPSAATIRASAAAIAIGSGRCERCPIGAPAASRSMGIGAAQKGAGSKPAQRRHWVASLVVGILIAVLIAVGTFILLVSQK
jgi:hypothetical protein